MCSLQPWLVKFFLCSQGRAFGRFVCMTCSLSDIGLQVSVSFFNLLVLFPKFPQSSFCIIILFSSFFLYLRASLVNSGSCMVVLNFSQKNWQAWVHPCLRIQPNLAFTFLLNTLANVSVVFSIFTDGLNGGSLVRQGLLCFKRFVNVVYVRPCVFRYFRWFHRVFHYFHWESSPFFSLYPFFDSMIKNAYIKNGKNVC